MILEIDRLNDTQAIISGTGTVDFDDTAITIPGASATIGNSGADASSGNLQLGPTPANVAFIVVGLNELDILFEPGGFNSGDAISGSLLVELDVETWAPVGTTGDVVVRQFGQVLVTGSYSVVGEIEQVPEPGSSSLLVLGLLFVARSRKRVRARQKLQQ